MDPIEMQAVVSSAIDAAIKENRKGEYIIYALSTVIVLVGCGVLVLGAVQGNGLVALAGAIAASLIFPAMRGADKMRTRNQLIRLLDGPVKNAKTPEQAAEAYKSIIVAFNNEFK